MGAAVGAIAVRAVATPAKERQATRRDLLVVIGAAVAVALGAGYARSAYQPLEAYVRIAFCAVLLCIALIDARTRLIPDKISIPGIAAAFAAGALTMPDVGLRGALLGMATALLIMVSGEFYRMVRGNEGIGMGDIKLLLMIGAFVGWPGLLFTLAAGGVSATLVACARSFRDTAGGANRLLQSTFAFGPHLCAAAAIYILFQTKFISG